MALFEWSEACSVNIPELDQHHKYIFSLVNHLHESMLCGRGRLLVAGMIDELVSYAQSHFAAEGAYMRSIAFAGLDLHEREHADFAREAEDFRRRYQAGTAELTVEIMAYMEGWLTNHIQNMDKQFAPSMPLPPLSANKADLGPR
jgi:hemerythrin